MQANSSNGKFISHLTMNTERIEELLQELIFKQDEIVYRLENMELTIKEKLSDSNYKLDGIQEELNWWEDKPTLAKQLLSALQDIDGSLGNIDISISSLER